MLIAGLGNPGSEYKNTRHNIGTVALDEVLRMSNVVSKGSWQLGDLALVGYGSKEFLALRPFLFMNINGEAVLSVAKRYKLDASSLLVLHDDIDIPLGEIKTKSGGGNAGHRGVASVENSMGDKGFMRVRIGVGRPPDGTDTAEYVLSAFNPVEREAAAAAAARAACIAIEIVTSERSDLI